MLKDYRAGKIANLVEKESGLKYVIVEEGKGNNLKKSQVSRTMEQWIIGSK